MSVDIINITRRNRSPSSNSWHQILVTNSKHTKKNRGAHGSYSQRRNTNAATDGAITLHQCMLAIESGLIFIFIFQYRFSFMTEIILKQTTVISHTVRKNTSRQENSQGTSFPSLPVWYKLPQGHLPGHETCRSQTLCRPSCC